MTARRPGALALVALLGGCVGTPRVSGVPGASPAPQVPWTPPPAALERAVVADSSARVVLPAGLAERIRRLTLAEIVDIRAWTAEVSEVPGRACTNT